MKSKAFNTSIAAVFMGSLLALGVTSCGPSAFVPGSNSSLQTAAGNMNIPPKVDIVMGVSMNGTMKNIYPGMNGEITNFIQGLENSGWDYRFVTIPLSEYFPGSSATYAPINGRVSVSHYHTNWPVAQWLPPFPGALYTDPSLKILPSLFSMITQFPADIDPNHNDGHETGVKNQLDFINRSDVRNNFIRNDALLAVMTISNGEDRSGGSWVYAGWGDPNTNKVWQPNATSDLNSLAMGFVGVKGNINLVKYYSLVAHQTTNCRGYGSWSGIRYEQEATILGGTSIDICTTQMSTALSSVANHLHSQRLNFVKKYLVIGNEPNVGTIKVTKYLGGQAGNAQVLAQDATNGWTYAGYMTNTNVIESPVPMDAQSGYFIELHGTAKLHGDDSANVEYQNAGGVVSH